MNNYFILMAAGSGERMKSELPKQFIEVNEIPILIHTFNKVKTLKSTKFIIVLPHDNFSKWKKLISKYVDDKVDLIRGDKERNLSVKNGINNINDDSGYVAIHDGVRPFITKGFVKKLFQEADKNGNAVPFTRLVNSLRKINNHNNHSVNRSEYVQIQTPQVYKISDIKNCMENLPSGHFNDEASLFDMFNIKINLVEGLIENIKITNNHDLIYFDQYSSSLKKKSSLVG